MAEQKKSVAALFGLDPKYDRFIVNIRRFNRDQNKYEDHYYMTVAGRLRMFWDQVVEKPNEAYVETTVKQEGSVIQVRAEASYGSYKAVGHASETIGKGAVNITSALENAETSAVGRALGNLGFGLLSAGDVASADEVKEAFNQQKSVKPVAPKKDTPKAQTLAKNQKCQDCFDEGKDTLIEQNVADYSTKFYGKPLCRAHQKTAQRIPQTNG